MNSDRCHLAGNPAWRGARRALREPPELRRRSSWCEPPWLVPGACTLRAQSPSFRGDGRCSACRARVHTPNMTGIGRPKPDDRTAVVVEPLAHLVVLRVLQPFIAPLDHCPRTNRGQGLFAPSSCGSRARCLAGPAYSAEKGVRLAAVQRPYGNRSGHRSWQG